VPAGFFTVDFAVALAGAFLLVAIRFSFITLNKTIR
jgi:hypothetical protein